MNVLKSLSSSIFSKDQTEENKKTMPMNINIGSVIEFDHLGWKLLGDKTKLKLEESSMIVDRYGVIKLTPSTTLYRFYSNNSDFVEVVLEYDEIQELRLFQSHDTVSPYSEEDWDFWVGDDAAIGQPNFELKCKTQYERAWMEDTDGAVYPVEMEEVLHFKEDGELITLTVLHMSMLYGRWINDDGPEWLLVSAEDRGEIGSVELYLGKDLSDTDIKVI